MLSAESKFTIRVIATSASVPSSIVPPSRMSVFSLVNPRLSRPSEIFPLISIAIFSASAIVFGFSARSPYRLIYCIFIAIGATIEVNLVWDLSDILNASMAIPNLIALLALSSSIFREVKTQ